MPGSVEVGALRKLDAKRTHYLRHVLRLKQGDTFVVFNGEGGEFSAKLIELSRHSSYAEINEWNPRSAESSVKTELGIGMSRGERMDFIVQKSVELGVGVIMPLFTEHSMTRLTEKRTTQKCIHWNKIVQSACEQSGRNIVPKVSLPDTLRNWVDGAKGLKLLFDPFANTSLSQVEFKHSTISLLCGPEGGLSSEECSYAFDAGFQPVKISPQSLNCR